MKVCFVNAYSLDAVFGGVENYIKNLSAELERQGIRTSLLSMPPALSSVFSKFSHVPSAFGLGFSAILKKHDADVYHSHAWAACANLAIRKPKISTAHGTSYGYLKWVNLPAVKKIYYRAGPYELERMGFKAADFVACVAEQARKDVCEGYGVPKSKTSVVQLYHNPKIFKPVDKKKARNALGLPLKKPIMLTSGRLDAFQKGFDLYAQVVDKLSNKDFVPLVGGKMLGSAQPFFKPPMRLSPVLPYDKVGLRYNAADFYVVTSRFEGSNITILEAMACGIPVVSFDVSGAADYIKDGKTGFLVKKFDVKDFADKCKMLIEDADLCLSMGERAAKKAKPFTIERMAHEYVKLYEKIL